jgi:chlorobactene glucosyltransferase
MITILLAWAGVLILAWRTRPAFPPEDKASLPPKARVSILIPCRNEVRNVPRLLASLQALDLPDKEIIVIDDHSTDGTAELVRALGVTVLTGAGLPPGWNGKNWACHQAAQHATGDYLLFTDADTAHAPDGPRRAVAFLERTGADLISALPFHRAETVWEKLLGPFQALFLTATAPGEPRPGRLFAIGQYLLFRRAAYEKFGGHAAVAAEYPDDLALSSRCVKGGGRYGVYRGRALFTVRMYANFNEFIDGWRRNFRAGLARTRLTAAVDVTLVYLALLGAATSGGGSAKLFPMIAALLWIAASQRRWGEFSLAGVVFFPFSIAVHTLVTFLAVWDLARKKKLAWKGRAYEGWSGQ